MAAQKESIRFNPYDFDGMIALMDDYENHEMMFGDNADGEHTTLSICKDHITMETLQSNGWTRTNVFWRDGTREEYYNR